MNTLEKISRETIIFMRGKYRLDEIGNGKDELKFKQGTKIILTIYFRDDKFVFLIIFGEKERECYELRREEFSSYINNYYENSETYHDGKWMFFDVTTLEQLEEIKKLIQIKKKPNRKPFVQEGAIYAQCGQRCDLCVHYVGTTDERRAVMIEHLNKLWENRDWSMRCEGCYSENCWCKDNPCFAKECAFKKELIECRECSEFPCDRATYADFLARLHTEKHYADEITWGILPYAPYQYE